MAYLYDTIPFQPGSRLTGVWTVPPACTDLNALALMSMVILGSDQDAHVESDFLTAHLPYAIGGLHGVDSCGTPWVLLVQVMPYDAANIVDSAHAHWPMADAVDRALTLNDQASLVWGHLLTRPRLLEAYRYQDVTDGEADGWTVAELLVGLLAECCYDNLPDIVTLAPHGCPFPDEEHECQVDTFRDIFAMWSSGALNPPEPDDDESEDDDVDDPWNDDQEPEVATPPRRLARKQIRKLPLPRSGYTRAWKKSKLRSWKTSRLRLVAVEQGWSAKKAAKMDRKKLIKALSTPRRRSVLRLRVATNTSKRR